MLYSSCLSPFYCQFIFPFNRLKQGYEEEVYTFKKVFAFLVNIEKSRYLRSSKLKKKRMEVAFNEIYLRDLYVMGKSDKKHRFQP